MQLYHEYEYRSSVNKNVENQKNNVRKTIDERSMNVIPTFLFVYCVVICNMVPTKVYDSKDYLDLQNKKCMTDCAAQII